MRKLLQLTFIILLFSCSKIFAQQANFTYASTPSGSAYCEGVTVIFTSTSTGATSWHWNFGPNAIPDTSNQQFPGIVNFPTCTFPPGTNNVTLTINGGGSANLIKTINVPIYCNPTACFTVPFPNQCANTPFNFSSSCSTVGGGSSSLSYVWDMGNGQQLNSANPSYTYPGADTGCFTVSLIVTNNHGCTAFTQQQQAVCIAPPPVFQISYTTSTTCLASLPVTFCATPVTGGNPPYTYSWSFPGGNPTTSNTPCQIVNYTTGSYSVTCVVTDASGCSTTQTISNIVNVGNNSTSIILSQDTICIGQCVNVSTAPASSYSWQIFPNTCVTPNTIQTTQTVDYCFTCPGTYIDSLHSVVNGCPVKAGATIHVFDKPVACISITSNPPSCSFPQTVNVSYCGPPTVPGYQYLWSFPGGNPSSYIGTSVNPNPPNGGAVTYNSCGHFSIALHVIGFAGCDSSIALNDTVKIDCPHACYTISPLPLPGHYCAPLTLNYNASCSTGNPTQYLWCVTPVSSPPCTTYSNLGPTPTLSFPTEGCYNVKLKIINQQGCLDSTTNLFPGGPICVGSQITPCFTADPVVTCAPVPVQFTNCTLDSNGIAGGPGFTPCTIFEWNFGDGPGIQSTVFSPLHLYTDTGLFDVMLVVNNCGCRDTLILLNYITVYPPIPSLHFTIDCATPNIVFFDASNSVGADTYTWTFPGGNPSSSNSPTPTVTYPMPLSNASYTAKVKVCNAASGCCDSLTVTVLIRNLQLLANIDTSVCYPETSVVVDSSLGAFFYQWTFFDLCNNSVPLPALTSTLRGYSTTTNYGAITWPGPGRYHVKLRIQDINTCLDSAEWNVSVHGLYPGFWGAPLSGCAPFNTTFHDTTNANCVSIPVSYKLNFGDGISSPFTPAGQPIIHTYATNGSYTVIETVVDQWQCQSVDSTVAYVNSQTPTVNFNVADSSICLGTQECFNNNTTGINLSYVWNFGDGDTSHAAFPCHTYLSTGTYTVTLVATDQNGCKDSLVRINYIIVGQVNVDFFVTDSVSTCPPLADTFFVNPYIPNGCRDYYWSFGDGAYSALDTPFHIYGFPGAFTVTLIVTDNCLGCSDTITKLNYINIAGPFSNPTATPDTVCAPQLVFFDLSPTNSVSFLWDFDDGTPLFSGLSAVSHLYTVEGIYYPRVQLSDGLPNGCTYFRSIDTIVVVIPHPGFISSTNDLCSNGVVSFIDTSNALGGILSYLWNFGDPLSTPLDTSTLQTPPPHNYSGFGDFIVSLTITTHGGCQAIAKDTIHVTAAPIANPIAPLTGICLGDSTHFTGTTTGPAAVCNVLWNFGVTPTVTSTLINPAFLYSSPGVYTVTFIAYGCNGCNDTSVLAITVNPLPTANAGPDQTICFEDTTLLIGSGGVSFIWSPGISLSDPINDSTLAFPFGTTTYTLIVTDVSGCKDTDDLVLTITQPPLAIISAGDTICPGDPFTLTASGGTTYHWNTGETTSSITVTPGVTTTYTVTASVGTCSDDTFAIVVVNPLPAANAGNPAEFCFGDSTQLNGSGGILFSWSPGNSLSDSIVFNPMANPTITTTYTLTVIDSLGCKNKDSVVITVHPLPIINAGIDKKICSGTCTQLNVTGAISYAWSPPLGLLNDSIPNPISCPSDTIMYFVSGTDVYGCVGNDSIKLFVLFPFTVQYPNDTCYCIGESSKLCAISTTQSTYKWKPPYGLDSTTVSCATASPSVTTTYTIYVSDSIGCYADTGDVVICIYSLPSVVASPDVTILVGTIADLTAYNSSNPGTGTLLWSPDSTLSCYTCENPEATPLQTTTYIVELTDLHGCKDEDTTVVKVYCNDNVLFVPNAFTPNNDGKNDYFHLDGKGIAKLNYLRIFNRWGQLVFETTDFNAVWDGKVNGKKSEPEVFDYLLEAICSTGETIRKQGNITLIR